jgi:hypothetical protein
LSIELAGKVAEWLKGIGIPADMIAKGAGLVVDLVERVAPTLDEFAAGNRKPLVDAVVDWLDKAVDLPWYLPESLLFRVIRTRLYKLVGVE